MEEKKRTIKDVSKVKQTEECIIIEIVENCKTGKCDCMSEEAKKKINFMDFRVKEGKPIIDIKSYGEK